MGAHRSRQPAHPGKGTQGSDHIGGGRLVRARGTVALSRPAAGRAGGAGPWRCSDRIETPPRRLPGPSAADARSEEHTSELQSLMRISYAVFCLKKKTTTKT